MLNSAHKVESHKLCKRKESLPRQKTDTADRYMATPPNPSQTVSSTAEQAFKYMRLFRPFLIKPPQQWGSVKFSKNCKI